MNNFYVQIISYNTGEIVKEKGPFSKRKAEKIRNGIEININHYLYYVTIFKKLDIEFEDAFD